MLKKTKNYSKTMFKQLFMYKYLFCNKGVHIFALVFFIG